MRDTLDMALSTLPGCGPHRAPGTILQIAQTSKTIDNALRIVMTSSPAIYIEESSVSQKPSASIPAPKAAKSTRSEEHTYELQSLMRISYAVFCLETKEIQL